MLRLRICTWERRPKPAPQVPSASGDDAVRRKSEASAEEPWQGLAQDNGRWARLEGAFIVRVLRHTAAHYVMHTLGKSATSVRAGAGRPLTAWAGRGAARPTAQGVVVPAHRNRSDGMRDVPAPCAPRKMSRTAAPRV